jgi:hypothetical protein
MFCFEVQFLVLFFLSASRDCPTELNERSSSVSLQGGYLIPHFKISLTPNFNFLVNRLVGGHVIYKVFFVVIAVVVVALIFLFISFLFFSFFLFFVYFIL